MWDIRVVDQAVHCCSCSKKVPSPYSAEYHLRVADYISETYQLQLDVCH